MINKALFNRNLQMIPRRFHGMNVCDVGYIPEKKERLNHVFDTFNYSIVLHGSGTYSSEGNHFSLEAPCIITQFPGVRSHYGPHPGTTWEEFYIMLPAEQLSWVSGTAPKKGTPLAAKVRYRQADQAGIVRQISDDELVLEFDRPQRAVTAGQSVVLYDGQNCLGGGIISWADTPPEVTT